MIELIFNPPKGLDPSGSFGYAGNAKLKKKLENPPKGYPPKEEVAKKYLFARKSGNIASLLDAMIEIPCSAEILVTVGDNKWNVRGRIDLWQEKDLLLVEGVISELEDATLNLAELCPGVKVSISFSLIQRLVSKK